jgi:eukaryotic-like serine/threonine-protein kinase
MSTDSQALIIVEGALAITDRDARAAFVVASCGRNAALRVRVEQLLAFEGHELRLLPARDSFRTLGVFCNRPKSDEADD